MYGAARSYLYFSIINLELRYNKCRFESVSIRVFRLYHVHVNMLYKGVLPGEAFRKLCFFAPLALLRSTLAGQHEKRALSKTLTERD